MPTYRYRCEKCSDEFEVWQSIQDAPLTTHDTACGGHLLKVLSPAGIVLKGAGFYKNDSRSKSSSSSAASRSSSSSDTGDSGKKGDGKESGAGASDSSSDNNSKSSDSGSSSTSSSTPTTPAKSSGADSRR